MTALLPSSRLDVSIQALRVGLARLIEQAGVPRLRECWPKWEHLLDDLKEQARRDPEFSISLVGTIGAGKTTLINAILGMRLLPTKEGQACTSLVCEIGYASDGRFHAEVEFVSRKDWDAEVQRLRADIGGSVAEGDGEEDKRASSAVIETALKKLRAVYKAGGETGVAWFLRDDLQEPLAVRRALKAGTEAFSADAGGADKFAEHLKLFLASDEPFWPLVRSVRIRGPFAALKGGLKLVDLPGVNDPNEAREQVTRRHLKECKLVWLVFGVKRTLTRDLVDLMQTEDFFRQLLMDGRSDRLTFIATHADDINFGEAAKQYKLAEEAPVEEFLKARKLNLQATVAQTLCELAGRLSDQTGEGRDQAESLAERLKHFTLFSVSARDYLAFTKKKGRDKPRLDTPEQTELPALLAHMKALAETYGLEHHSRSILAPLDTLLADVGREIQALCVHIEQQAEMTAKQREEVQAAATAALGFLDGKLKEYGERYRQDLSSRRDVLMERFKHGKQRGREAIDATLAHWQAMAANTLGAVCRNAGRHTTTTGLHDLPQQLAKPLLDSIAFTWDEFFGDKLTQVTNEWHGKLLQLARDNARQFFAATESKLGGGSRLRPDLHKLQETTEKVLAEQLGQSREQLQEKIDTARATLYERVPDRVRASMRPAFLKAGKEAGTGMRNRIIGDHLRAAALEVARVVFQDAEKEIDTELRALQDGMTRSYKEMCDTVRGHADINARNLGRDAHELTLEAIAHERRRLQTAANALTELRATLAAKPPAA